MSMTKFEYVFILFGMTGSGKSSSGNTLLDRDDCFETSISFNSCTRAAELACKEFSEYIINVVDTPGIFDTDQTVAQTLEIIYEGISQLVDGISAFLFVLKLCGRCTKEQNETIEAFKRSFGDSFVKNHCIIVLSGGDLCGDLNNDNIQEWCRRTENVRDGSDLKKLMIECDYRVVLFNNKDKTKRDASVDKLLNYFHPQAPRYTNETFQKCIDARNEYVTNLGFPGQRSDIQRQLSLLENDFDAMYQNKGEGEMDQIKDRAKKLMETVQNASAGTHKMDDLKFRINQIIEKTGKIPENGEARMKAIQDLKNEVQVKRPQGKESYNFMLLGKTGAGKSSTGNTLLGRQCFRISHSFTSCSEISGKECNEFSNYIFKVVDTPGIHDMNTSKYEILKNISEGISLIPEGFNAFLFVLKLGERATRELTETINILKALFGDSQFQKSCIIGLTYGDGYDEIHNDNIQEWCKNEDNIKVGSVFGTLLRECDYRVVLFYNRHVDKREESVSKLLSYVNPQAPRYTNEHFQKCADARDAYMTSLGLPEQRAKKSCIVQ